MATIAVGDIQGCYAELTELLDLVQFSETRDTLWATGDLINRGPSNVETLEYLMSLPNFVFVLGNHDLHFLAVACGYGRASRRDTFSDLLEDHRCERFVDWLRAAPLLHNDPSLGYLMVHAGIPPTWSIEQAEALAHELERCLSGPGYPEFLSQMYGNEPNNWRDGLAGPERLRVIANYLTRLRYCKASGEMNLTHKADIRPEGFDRWFDLPRPATPQKILFGHWAAIDGRTGDPRYIGLDTGCVWGRTLTAVRLEDGERFVVDSRQPLSLESD